MDLYWGDMHTQFKPQWQPEGNWEDVLRQAFEDARDYLDFFPIVYYPAQFYNTEKELHVETVGKRPEHDEEWNLINELVKEYHEAGTLVTFPGYEWTGDRTRWGDCNVFFHEEDPPLDLSLHIDDLFANLRKHNAIAIPHHTGYKVADRGKDWDHHDEKLCPVAEIFSGHGSSEGCNTPFSMTSNAQMSPRVSGGTIQDALARGYRLGIMASGDNGTGFAGKWGTGLLGLYAAELTRDGIWEAIAERRTYGITGDRIKLQYQINGEMMGQVIESAGPVQLRCHVECTEALDRIEVIRNNRVAHTLCHNGSWRPPEGRKVRVKVPLEFGWGPTAAHGFDVGKHIWDGELSVEDGEIVSVEGRFTRHGQSIDRKSDNRMEFELTTRGRGGGNLTEASQQSFVAEIEADDDAPITLNVDGRKMNFTLAGAMRESDLLVFDEKARQMVKDQFGHDPDEVENRDVFYHNAYIVKRHTAIPQAGYDVELEWEDDEIPEGRNFYYLRISQLNGQMAWSSPIWVDNV